jgi:hypothetical protein
MRAYGGPRWESEISISNCLIRSSPDWEETAVKEEPELEHLGGNAKSVWFLMSAANANMCPIVEIVRSWYANETRLARRHSLTKGKV